MKFNNTYSHQNKSLPRRRILITIALLVVILSALGTRQVLKTAYGPVSIAYAAEQTSDIMPASTVKQEKPKPAARKKNSDTQDAASDTSSPENSPNESLSYPSLTPESPSGERLYRPAQPNDRPATIRDQPTAVWLGEWSGDVRSYTASIMDRAISQDALAVFVAYNIPVRDCGLYSAGGANSSENYRAWIRNVAEGIGERRAMIILEPDALPGLDCLSEADQTTRLSDLSYAVNVLATQTRAAVYLDAGNYSWKDAGTMIDRLQRANVAQARGFSLNVSGYGWTDQSVAYGETIGAALGKHYVIDTSRNGNGPAPNNEWCNPRGRALGERPTTSPSPSRADAYLWVKIPGESDGTCNGGPSAGAWWPELADELIRNAS